MMKRFAKFTNLWTFDSLIKWRATKACWCCDCLQFHHQVHLNSSARKLSAIQPFSCLSSLCRSSIQMHFFTLQQLHSVAFLLSAEASLSCISSLCSSSIQLQLQFLVAHLALLLISNSWNGYAPCICRSCYCCCLINFSSPRKLWISCPFQHTYQAGRSWFTW